MRDVASVNSEQGDRVYETTKRMFVGFTATIAVGLAVAGTLDRTTGGVILLVGWLGCLLGLHRMGRAGSTPRD
jgi:hypothetical protein